MQFGFFNVNTKFKYIHMYIGASTMLDKITAHFHEMADSCSDKRL
jgi:hypothetical protein